MSDAPRPTSCALAASMSAGTLVERLGIVVTEWSAERVVATMPVEGNTQPYGLLHGGASWCWPRPWVAGRAFHAGPERVAVGIEINATHHRAAKAGVGHRRRDTRSAWAAALHVARSASPTTRADWSAPRASRACCGTPRRAQERRGLTAELARG